MAKWAWVVKEIVDGRYDAMVEEYHNDLDSRKILDVVLGTVDEGLRKPLGDWLLPHDRRFEEATLLLARPIAGSSDPKRSTAAWRGYWRVPRALGPELREGLVRRGLV